MLNNNIVVRENEVVKYDIDDYMDNQLSMFQEIVKSIEVDKIKQFRNWVKLFKTLNYDIIDNLSVNHIYRFNKFSAVVELEFNKKVEYDFISFDEKEMMVTILTVKNGQVAPKVIRRMLIPTTSEEALMYIESEIENDIIDSLAVTYKDLMKHKDRYKLSDGLNKHLLSKVDFNGKTNKPATENKKVESNKEENKQEVETSTVTVTEPEFKIEKKETVKKETKPVEKKENKIISVRQNSVGKENKNVTKKETKPTPKPVEKKETKPVEKKETKQFKFNRPLVGVFERNIQSSLKLNNRG